MKSIKLLLAASIFFFSATFGFICAQKSQRMVVSHYMLGMVNYDTTVAALKKDIIVAHDQGVDAFQLNMNSWRNDKRKRITANMYQAASECDFPFYLFPSADFNANAPAEMHWSYEDIYNYLQLYGSHPNHLKVDGRPLFTSWLGDRKGVEFWKNVKMSLMNDHGINMFYVAWHPSFLTYGPDIPLPEGIDKYLDEWNGVIDGFWWWGSARHPFPAGTDSGITQTNSIPTGGEYLSNALKTRSMPFMTPVVPSFWATCKNPCRYYEHKGALGMESQWMSIINNQTARWVNLVTWNDLGEDTYWSPHPNPISIPLRYIVYSHAGYAELNKYYIQWWKTGQQPAIGKDKIFYFYRTQFHDAVPLTETCTFNCSEPLPDKIYVTTMLVRPAKLTIYSGSKTTVHEASAGIYYWEADMSDGSQRFTIVRDGKVVIDATGREKVEMKPVYKSWSLFSGFSEAYVNKL